MTQCPDCGSYNHFDDSVATAYAYECWCCLTPHWLSEDHMFDYITITDSNILLVQEDLELRVPYFADAYSEWDSIE